MTNEYKIGEPQRASSGGAKRANSNNDEESIFLTSSSEEDDKQINYTRPGSYQPARKQPATAASSKYVSANVKNKQYDEYDPENIDDYSHNKKQQKYHVNSKYGKSRSENAQLPQNSSPSGSDDNELHTVSDEEDEDDQDQDEYVRTSEEDDEDDDERQAAAAAEAVSSDESDDEDNRVLSDFLSDRDEEDHEARKRSLAKAAAKAAKLPSAKSEAPLKKQPAVAKSGAPAAARSTIPAKSHLETNSKSLKKPSSDHLVSLKKSKPSPSTDKPASSPKVAALSKSAPKATPATAEAAKVRKRSNEEENEMETSTSSSGKIINLGSGFKIPKRQIQDTSLELKSNAVPEKRAKLEDGKTEKTSNASKEASVAKAKPVKAASIPVNKTPATTAAVKPAAPVAKPAAPVKNVFQDSSAFMEAFGTSKPKAAPKPKATLAKSTSLDQSEPSTSDAAASKSSAGSATTTTSSSSSSSNASNINNIHNINRDDQSADSKSDSNGGIKSNLSEPVLLKKSANKKKVVWADTSASKPLEIIHTFYLDESEKALKKSGLVKGADMAKIERLGEKELRFKMTNGAYDSESYGGGEESSSAWPAQLIKIDLPDSIIQPEIHSAENEIQKIREASTLAVLMFKQFLPDSPSEPTADTKSSSIEQIQTKIIPLEDITQQINAMNESTDAERTSAADSGKGYDNHASSSFEHYNRNNFNRPNASPVGLGAGATTNGAFNHKQYNPNKAFNGKTNDNDLPHENGNIFGFTSTTQKQQQTHKLASESPVEQAVSAHESPAPAAAESAPSSILNIVSKAAVLIQTDEAAEKIKQILKQIGSTPSIGATSTSLALPDLSALNPAPVAPVVTQPPSFESVIQALLTVNKVAASNDPKSAQQLMSIPINPSVGSSDANDDDNHSPNFNKFGNNRNFSNDNNNFRKSKWNNNNNSNNGNYDGNNGNWNKNKYNNNNNGGNGNNSDNNRNIFVNSHKRGMGNRGGFNEFRGNNKGGFGRGNGGNNNNNNTSPGSDNNRGNGQNNGGNNRWQNNFNNNNNNRGGRFGNKGFNRSNFDHDKNYENNNNNDDASFNHRRRSDGDDDWSDSKNFKRGGGGRRNSNNEDAGGKNDMPSSVAPHLPMVKANTTAQGGSWV